MVDNNKNLLNEASLMITQIVHFEDEIRQICS